MKLPILIAIVFLMPASCVAQEFYDAIKFRRSNSGTYLLVLKPGSKTAKELGVSEKQIEAIKKIRESWYEEVTGLRKENRGRLGRREYDEAKRDISEKMIDQINALMSEKQKARLVQLVIQADRHRSLFSYRVSKAMGLSDELVGKLKNADLDIVNEFREMVGELRKEAIKNGWSQEEAMKKYKALEEEWFQKATKKCLSMLSESQRKKYFKLRGD